MLSLSLRSNDKTSFFKVLMSIVVSVVGWVFSSSSRREKSMSFEGL